jgi:cysteine desulfurase
MIYLDHAATTPMRPEARDAMTPFLGDGFGNPSGVHAVSRRAKNALEGARERAAELLGAAGPLEIVFTGGGTESDNLGIAGPVLARGGGVAVSAIEHEAVLETAGFLARLGHGRTVIGVGADGRVDPAEAASLPGDTALVSVMAANNETGIRQPVAAVAAAVRRAIPGAVVHTDAVQEMVSEPVWIPDLGVDLLTIASHKLGGPKGVGLLWIREGVALEPVLHGGGQEMGRRSGTHDVAGIAGMVAAMESAVADRERFRERVGEARERFEARLWSELGATATASAGHRLVQHSHLHVPGVAADSLLIRLDAAGVAAAAGSACRSGAIGRSHVLAAMHIGEEQARSSLRFTFGWTSTPEEADAAARIVVEQAEALR